MSMLPIDCAISPIGVRHLMIHHPDVLDTFCGESVAYGDWHTYDAEVRPMAGSYAANAVTCLPCFAERKWRQSNVVSMHPAEMATQGVDRCECGCKYWENDRCIDCGAEWTPDTRLD